MTIPQASIQWMSCSRVISIPECLPQPVVKAAPGFPARLPSSHRSPCSSNQLFNVPVTPLQLGGAQQQRVGFHQVAGEGLCGGFQAGPRRPLALHSTRYGQGQTLNSWAFGIVEDQTRIPHLAQTSDAVNRQLSCFSSRYMNLLAVFQITCVPTLEAPDG